MSIRDAFENCLVELNKVQAPSLLLDDFVYLFNKAVQQYINIRYNMIETKQQLTDDLRVLQKTAKLTIRQDQDLPLLDGKTVELPSDYMHMLNCICTFNSTKANKCGEKKTLVRGVNKMDTTQWSHVIDNYYMKPSVKQPYYYIMNLSDTEPVEKYNESSREEAASEAQLNRYGNPVLPTMQIKYGEDPKWELSEARIDYLRAPYYYTLTQDQLDDIQDQSMIIEFPDYVVYEIINTLIKLILENGGNPRIQTHMGVNQSIV